jgi:hypothetical protein
MKYVGITKRPLALRLNAHKNAIHLRRFTTHPLYIAVKEYGFDAFDVSVLATTMCIEKAGMYEHKYIKEFNCRKPQGYNVREGGVRGFAEGPRSEQFKAACKMRAKKQFSDPAQIERVRRQQKAFWDDPVRSKKARERLAHVMDNPERREQAMRGLEKARATPKTIKNGWKMPEGFGAKISARNIANREKMSAVTKAKWQDPEWRAKVIANGSQKRTGIKRSEKANREMKERLAKKWADPEYKAKMVAKLLAGQKLARAEGRGQKYTSEIRKKLSESKKKLWSDPDYRARRMEASQSPEVRAKISAAAKAQWRDPEKRKLLIEHAKRRMKDPKMRASALLCLELGRKNRGKGHPMFAEKQQALNLGDS